MSLVINTNVGALSAQRNLASSSMALNNSLQKLSSGYKINRAADDAAGLRISETLRTQIRGSQKGLQNLQDGNNMLNIVEGSYSTIQDSLQRMRELVVQAANDTNSNTERQAIDQELAQLKTNITQVSESTAFNGKNLMRGSYSNFRIQLGANSASANNTINIGSIQQKASYGVLVSAGGGFGANGTITTSGRSYGQMSKLIDALDAAISKVGVRRALIGAYQNRLDNAAQNTSIRIQNFTASESAIRNVDVATESSNMTRFQILQQAGVSVLAQSNNSSQLALQLLRG